MARPRSLTTETILSTLRAHILAEGPSVSLAAVAAELGVTEPALYKRFGTRKAMIFAALGDAFQPQWALNLEHGPDDRPLREQLHETLHAMAAFFARATPSLSALRESQFPIAEIFATMKEPPPLAAMRALSGWLQRAHQRGLCRALPFDSTALAIMGAVQVRYFLERILGHPPTAQPIDDYLNDLVQLLTDGAAPRPSANPEHP